MLKIKFPRRVLDFEVPRMFQYMQDRQNCTIELEHELNQKFHFGLGDTRTEVLSSKFVATIVTDATSQKLVGNPSSPGLYDEMSFVIGPDIDLIPPLKKNIENALKAYFKSN